MGVKYALQQPDRDTLIEQSLTLIEQLVKQNTVIKQNFPKHNHDIKSIILSIFGLNFEHNRLETNDEATRIHLNREYTQPDCTVFLLGT